MPHGIIERIAVIVSGVGLSPIQQLPIKLLSNSQLSYHQEGEERGRGRDRMNGNKCTRDRGQERKKGGRKKERDKQKQESDREHSN